MAAKKGAKRVNPNIADADHFKTLDALGRSGFDWLDEPG